MANANGGPDNISAIVVDVLEAPEVTGPIPLPANTVNAIEEGTTQPLPVPTQVAPAATAAATRRRVAAAAAEGVGADQSVAAHASATQGRFPARLTPARNRRAAAGHRGRLVLRLRPASDAARGKPAGADQAEQRPPDHPAGEQPDANGWRSSRSRRRGPSCSPR